MKILGINFETKNELKEKNVALMVELEEMLEMFPFKLGQTVYDVALKNAKGRYTKTNASIEYSTITEIIVDEKNYFSLAKRLRRNNVFFDCDSAKEYLDSVCE